MNTYIKLDGTEFTGRFMKAPNLLHNHFWENVSKLGAAPMIFREKAYKLTALSP